MTTPWRPSLGAILDDGGTVFRVWAPAPRSVSLVLYDEGHETIHPMERSGEYWTARVEGVAAGRRYRFQVDGTPYPDPCSRFQPAGVHGPSEVIDPRAFRWDHDTFVPPDPADLVIYECHIGTLTVGGTFAAAIHELPRLKELGVTALELMPVAAFPGSRNWGYDGAALFAPSEAYGRPGYLRRLVDAAHATGLAVILDVVYNHFGPDGNYTGVYSPYYLTERHRTPWGGAINFAGEHSEAVRQFFIENLLHWVAEYHVDGFRLDATHVIFDESPVHILAEMRETLRPFARKGRDKYLFAESHENDVTYLRPVERGGYGMDGVWADDFHHVVRNILQPEREGYLASFEGTAEELARVITQGFLYEGQPDLVTAIPRGTKAREQPWRQFVYCIQNHDQVANRPFGERLHHRAARDEVMAATLLLLLLPQTPLLFQGQEFMASSPFLYFTDHNRELGRLVTEGRRAELSSFRAFSDPEVRELIPDPQAAESFLRSKLRLDESRYGLGQMAVAFHRELLSLRAGDPVLSAARRTRAPMEAVARDRAVLVRIEAPSGVRWIAVNFGAPVAFDIDADAELVLHSNMPRFGGAGPAPAIDGARLDLPARTAAFLRLRP